MRSVSTETRFTAFVSAPGSSRKKVLGEMRRQLKSLPPDECPTLVDLADELTVDDPDGLFRFGLEIWLHGLEKLSNTKA